jgi:hypothetical protein
MVAVIGGRDWARELGYSAPFDPTGMEINRSQAGGK